MHLIAVTTPNYVPKAMPFLHSLSVVRSAAVHVVLLDFNDKTDPAGHIEKRLRFDFPQIDFRSMEVPPTASFGMIQDCVWDAFDDLSGDELACLCDADIVVQRSFTEGELRAFDTCLDYKSIAAYWNGGEWDNLWLEGRRILLSEDWIMKYKPTTGWTSVKCMNCGVMIGRVGMFRRVQKEYGNLYSEFAAASDHRSRCQFLLNYVWHRLNLTVKVLSPSTHLHGHFGDGQGTVYVPSGTAICDGVLTFNGEKVMFAHNFPDIETVK